MSQQSSITIDGQQVPLSSQVGGHAGVTTSADGSLLIKPALPVEVEFYRTVGATPGFAPLLPFIPKFYGTLVLQGEVDESAGEGGETKIKAVEGSGKESIVLENLSNTFLRPNILDIKLGTVLYDEDAAPEKRTRMEKTARETTSLETGVRMTGFQIHDYSTGTIINTPREYGKNLTIDDLPGSISCFFPVASSASQHTPPEESSWTSVSSTEPTNGTGLPAKLLQPILTAVHENVTKIRAALGKINMRMVGGSILVIYESDWARAEEGLELLKKAKDAEEDEDEEDEDEDEHDNDDEDKPKKVGPPFVVKVIDFAHTRIKSEEEGPDQGVLLGVDTTLRLLSGRLNEVPA